MNVSLLLELSLVGGGGVGRSLLQLSQRGGKPTQNAYRIAIMEGMTVVGHVAMSPPSSPPNFSTAATAPIAT